MSAPDWLDRDRYPFRPRWFELPAGRMHYVDEGEGTPIVMVHGNPTWSFLYRHQVRRLSSRYRCVAPDHLGFGLSDKPPAWNYLPERHAANLAALIDALELEGITLVVQDWGGPIGLSYALRRPENVRGIVILNTWMWPVHDDAYYVAFSTIVGGPAGRLLIRRLNLFARPVMRAMYGDGGKLTPEIHEHYLRPLATPEDRKGSSIFPREVVGSSAWLGTLWGRRERLEGIPKAIVWGMTDVAFREKELGRWTAAFPDADVTRLEGVGHFVQEEAPEDLVGAMERLLERAAPGAEA